LSHFDLRQSANTGCAKIRDAASFLSTEKEKGGSTMPKEEVVAFSHGVSLSVAIAGALGGLAFAFAATDPVMRFHGALFVIFCAAAAYWVATHPHRVSADEQAS
jgi:hypothetical protein